VNDVYSLENLPRLRTLVRHYAESDAADAFMVTLAGDFVSPSVLSSLDAGRAMVECMRAVGVTHATLGNHEDDLPMGELAARLKELGAIVLGTNVKGCEGLPAHAVVDVAGVKVGLVGVVMNDPAVYRRVPFGAARIENANDAALDEAARLRADGCACVLAMTHQTIGDDRALAHAARAAGIPLVIGGHEHTPFVEEVEGVWIVKAGMDAANAVVVDLAWDGDAMPKVRAKLEAVAGYAEDAAVRALVDARMSRVHDLETATLMTLPPNETLSSVGTRATQTSLGALVCSLVRDALDAEACIFNGGGIRGAREYRDRFTYGDLKHEVPFDNEVVVASLPGRVLRDAIVHSRAKAPAESGGFLQVDDRVVANGDVIAIAGTPLDEERTYEVALVREMLLGMDHNAPLEAFAKARPELVPPAGSGRDVKLVLVEAFALALWRKLGGFDAVDTNKDGRISVTEIAEAITRTTAEPASPITADLVKSAIDATGESTKAT
jgi:2',3'-cyclic-nucleotide 2'-phosphodiesterase (5'-nucleotidase family)